MEHSYQSWSVLQKALAGSLLLHICLLIVISLYSQVPAPDFHVLKTPTIQVTVANNDAQSLDAVPLESQSDQPIQESEEESPLIESDEVAVSEEPQTLEPVLVTEAVLEVESEELSFNNSVNSALDALQLQSPESITQESFFSAEALDAAITSFASSHLENLGREAIELCMKYKNRHGSSDCPQFAAPFTPTQRAENQTEQLLDDMDFLRSLMAGDSIASESARAFYYIKDEEYVRLNGGGGNNFMLSTTDNVIAGDTVLGLISTDGQSLSLLGGLVNFGLDGSMKFFNSDKGISLPELQEGVDYGAQNSEEGNMEESEDNSPPVFEVATPLFQTR